MGARATSSTLVVLVAAVLLLHTHPGEGIVDVFPDLCQIMTGDDNRFACTVPSSLQQGDDAASVTLEPTITCDYDADTGFSVHQSQNCVCESWVQKGDAAVVGHDGCACTICNQAEDLLLAAHDCSDHLVDPYLVGPCTALDCSGACSSLSIGTGPTTTSSSSSSSTDPPDTMTITEVCPNADAEARLVTLMGVCTDLGLSQLQQGFFRMRDAWGTDHSTTQRLTDSLAGFMMMMMMMDRRPCDTVEQNCFCPPESTQDCLRTCYEDAGIPECLVPQSLSIFAPRRDIFGDPSSLNISMDIPQRYETFQWNRHYGDILLHMIAEPGRTSEEWNRLIEEAGGELSVLMLSGYYRTFTGAVRNEVKGAEGFLHGIEETTLPPSVFLSTYDFIQQDDSFTHLTRLFDVAKLGIFMDNLLPVTLFAATNIECLCLPIPTLEIEGFLKNMMFELLWFDDALADLDGETLTSASNNEWAIQVVEDPAGVPLRYAHDRVPVKIFISNADGPLGLVNCSIVPGFNRTNILTNTGVIHRVDCLFPDIELPPTLAPTLARSPAPTTSNSDAGGSLVPTVTNASDVTPQLSNATSANATESPTQALSIVDVNNSYTTTVPRPGEMEASTTGGEEPSSAASAFYMRLFGAGLSIMAFLLIGRI